MRVYIAYKYTNVSNKEDLIKNLTRVAEFVESLGHQTFILGRDVQNWKKEHFSTAKTIPFIFKNLVKSDVLLAYIDCEEKSKGLSFETKLAKLLDKKIIFLKGKKVSQNGYCFKESKIIEFETLEEVKEKLKNEL